MKLLDVRLTGQSKYVLITGASSGIGRASAITFARAKFNLILIARDRQRLNALKKDILKNLRERNKTLVKIHIFHFDLSRRQQLQNFLKQNPALLKKVVVLLNNAGIICKNDNARLAKMGDWQKVIQTNLVSVMQITHGMLPYLQGKKSGHIVNIGSVAGRWTPPGNAAYSATKFAIRSFTESLRMDLLGTGIRVTNIEPGLVRTQLSKKVVPKNQKGFDFLFGGIDCLEDKDIADTILWCVQRPPHVNVQELVIFPTDEAGLYRATR